MEHVWNMYGICIEYGWDMHWIRMEYASNMHGSMLPQKVLPHLKMTTITKSLQDSQVT